MQPSSTSLLAPELNTELQSFINFFSDQLNIAEGNTKRLNAIGDRLRTEPCEPDGNFNKAQDFPKNGLLSKIQAYGDMLMNINARQDSIITKLEQII
jgi:hypothetical protein